MGESYYCSPQLRFLQQLNATSSVGAIGDASTGHLPHPASVYLVNAVGVFFGNIALVGYDRGVPVHAGELLAHGAIRHACMHAHVRVHTTCAWLFVIDASMPAHAHVHVRAQARIQVNMTPMHAGMYMQRQFSNGRPVANTLGQRAPQTPNASHDSLTIYQSLAAALRASLVSAQPFSTLASGLWRGRWEYIQVGLGIHTGPK